MKYFALTLALLVPLAYAQDNSPEQTTTTPDNAAAASMQETAPAADSAAAQETALVTEPAAAAEETAPAAESTAASTQEAVLAAEPAIVSAQETASAPAAQDPAQTDNDPVFQYHLGQEYALRRDYPTARTWFAKAAAQNNADAQTALGILDYYGIASDKQRDAAKWFAKAAKQNHPVAYDWQGNLAADNQNPAQARQKYNRAAERGSTSAMRNLGLAWLSGKGGAQNVEQAREWLEKAATGQPADAAAMRHLALDIYHAGKGVAADNKQALDWLQRASDAGDSTAALILGQIYRRGDWGETADENKACAYYAQSAAQNGGLPAALILQTLQHQKKCADTPPAILPEDNNSRLYWPQERALQALKTLETTPPQPAPQPAPAAVEPETL
nr:tetratricopeptide repeat protein [uncultured Cardiobacterium sp.]